jgi:hypothetical protein
MDLKTKPLIENSMQSSLAPLPNEASLIPQVQWQVQSISRPIPTAKTLQYRGQFQSNVQL